MIVGRIYVITICWALIFSLNMIMKVAQAEPERLSAAEIAEALSGNTVDGLWGSTRYRSYFAADGTTLYQPEGRAPDRGKWRADAARDRYCSGWERSGWGCYDVYRDGDTIIWGIPGTDTRYPSILLQGNRL